MRTETHLKSSKHTSANKQASPAVKHDVIVVLKQDHAMVKKLFHQFERLAKHEDFEGKVLVANQICAELIAHTTAEEEIFYPAVKAALHDDFMLNEAKVEHDSAKDLIAQIQDMDLYDPMYDAKMKVLSEYIFHHVEEEETQMFPKVRESDMIDLRKMAALLSDRKEALLDEACDMEGEIDPKQLKMMVGLISKQALHH